MMFVFAALATYYTALVLTQQDGPFALFLKLRNQFTDDTSWIARGLRCLVCMSLYTSALFTFFLVYFYHISLNNAVFVLPGLAGASVILDRWWKR